MAILRGWNFSVDALAKLLNDNPETAVGDFLRTIKNNLPKDGEKLLITITAKPVSRGVFIGWEINTND
ncbi:hypothetical protein IKF73_02565 [Candidatus Saccharibacteria bacterium]|nr:hypothetical protein [Candidatus Saccharibacteria bacterium]